MMNRKVLALCAGVAFLAGCQTVSLPFGPSSSGVRAQMTASDIDHAVATMQIVLESSGNGEGLPWLNAETGNSGEITVLRTFQTDEGRFCRVFRDGMLISGASASFENTACRDESGTWRLEA